MTALRSSVYDTIVIGSGFGGAMVALPLVESGQRVLMLERGDWVPEGPQRADPVRGFFQLTPAYTLETAYEVRQRKRRHHEGICACVGGPSVFYGGAAFRLRREDFHPPAQIVGNSGAEWPFSYDDLEPHYARAEMLLGVAGRAGEDPTEPPRSAPYPRSPVALAPISRRIVEAAQEMGLHPFRIPLAFDERSGACLYCDGYACHSGSKHDLASRVIPRLIEGGLELRPATVAIRLEARRGRVVGVEVYDRTRRERRELRAERVVLAAGALASPHLLLASGLASENSAGDAIGRYLMRHCNAFVYAFFPKAPNPEGLHHKQVAINDFYFGDPEGGPADKLGNIQQVMHPQPGGILRGPARRLARAGGLGRALERAMARAIAPASLRMTGLQVIAEDQPRWENRIELERGGADAVGLPRARIAHAYTERDLAARAALVRRAKQILGRVPGAHVVHVHEVETFSHAVGTVRAGPDPRRAPLDEFCQFRGIANLYVVDGSFMPTSGGVNPSLTIAANALRVGERVARS